MKQLNDVLPFDESGRVEMGTVDDVFVAHQFAEFALRWEVESGDDQHQTGAGHVEEDAGNALVFPFQPRFERTTRKAR